MQIIGITGTLGAGKGTIVDYLVKEYGFKHYSVRTFLIEEIKKRNISVNRDSMVLVANDLRSKHSPSYIIDMLYQRAFADGKNAIIESIRTPGEVYALREKGHFVLLAVDALPVVRYERIVERNSETDKVSYQIFIENEQREMEAADPTKQNLSECIKQADYVLNNNLDFNDLYGQVDQIMKTLNINK